MKDENVQDQLISPEENSPTTPASSCARRSSAQRLAGGLVLRRIEMERSRPIASSAR